jgi:thioredoxin-related protein
MVFFNENGGPIMPVVGYYKPQQLEPYLKMIKQGDYASFSNPGDMRKYVSEFISNFSDL